MSEDSFENVLVERKVSFEVGGDGRTLEALIVPWDKDATVADPPEYRQYTERWKRGTFDKQTSAPDRVKVWLNFEHEPGLRGIVGHGVELRDEEDGLHGTFRVHPNADGDKALHFIREGLTTGLSLEAVVTRSRRAADGVVERLRARLEKVSLTGIPAYKDATVIAVREEPEPDPEPDPEPEPDPAARAEVDAILSRHGWEPLVRRAIVRRPWDGSAARFEDSEYQRSCLVCRPGDEPPKTRCSLPVLEPNGDLNVNGMHAAAARMNQTGMSMELKAQAARKLVRYYRQAGEEPPPMLVAMAGR